MTRSALVLPFVVSLILSPRSCRESPNEQKLAQALERGLPIVQKAAANYPTHRDCFSCHHQTLPMLAMVTFLLKTQEKEGHWVRQTSRPPLEDSNVMCTTLAIRGLQKYAVKSQSEKVDKAVHLAKKWLAAAPLKTEEDKVARLWSVHLLGGKPDEIKAARSVVLADQREDGGWAQLDSMKSDAYATGQALFVLQDTGLATTDAAYQRGVQFLLKTQEKDGSWLVVTRSRPIQTMFDNGDPHGKNQFISTPATGWALAALAKAHSLGPAKK